MAAKKPARSGPTPTILVADDDPQIRAMLTGHLGQLGYRVLEASDGEAALETARAERPALAILDVMMPNLNGWEVARAIRSDKSLGATRILMLTGIGEHINELASPRSGADAFLDKPFEFPALEKKIAGLLGPSA